MRFGIDLGGTKIEIVALDPDGCELIRRRIATPQRDYRATIDAVTELVRSIGTNSRPRQHGHRYAGLDLEGDGTAAWIEFGLPQCSRSARP